MDRTLFTGTHPFTVDVEQRADGTVLIGRREPLGAYPPRLTDPLLHWAAVAPERTFLARRGLDHQWIRLSYRQVLKACRAIGTALLSLGLSPNRPILILSGNGLEHQLLALAAMYIGVPFAPISPAYSLADRSFAKLRHAAASLTPGLVAAFGSDAFEDAVEAVAPADSVIVSDRFLAVDRAFIEFDRLIGAVPAIEADKAQARSGPDTVAKFLLTSGSTGVPKIVTTTHRMLCSNQAMLRTALPFVESEPPLLVDWLPWSHTFGGSHNIGLALMNGGSFYIDDGRPTREGVQETVRNLRELSPTVYFNVPKGFAALIPFLRTDEALRASYFRDLRANFYAGACLSQPIWDDLDRIALAATGRRVPMLTGLGATETAPAVTFTTADATVGAIGLPAPGQRIRLVPVDGRLEIRVKGPNVMPGFWREPELTAGAFDEEGYFRLGDAVRFIDPAEPSKGLLFEGRLSEDFKLSTGTWVRVGPLREQLMTVLAPIALDAVLAAPGRDYLSLVVVLDLKGCVEFFPSISDCADVATFARADPIRAEVTMRLRRFSAAHSSTSLCIRRAVFLDVPLSHEEVTQKGTINQAAVREGRASLIEALYTPLPTAAVMVITEEGGHES